MRAWILGLAFGCGTADSRPPSPAPVAPAPAPVAPPVPVASAPIPVPSRLVAVGDLHGDADAARRVLQDAGLIDAKDVWIGGDAVLVQTGDTTDRGPDSRGVLALLRDLAPRAEAAGGRVVALLGNHESMNLLGDWRYVSEADVAVYGGISAREAAFSPTGDDGRWLRTLGAVARVGEDVFCHGGIRPEYAALGVDGINRRVRAALSEADAVRGPVGADGRAPQIRPDDPVLGPDGPLWYRGYVSDPEAQICPVLADALEKLGARRMVVGHTTRESGRIEARCNGALVVIDTGISAHYGGHRSAFEWVGGDARAVYPDGRQDLPDP
jgi:hypothetical protein